MDSTETHLDVSQPKKKALRGAYAIVFGICMILGAFLFPGSRDFIKNTGAILLKSASDTFVSGKFGKPVVEVDLSEENFSMPAGFYGSRETSVNSEGKKENSVIVSAPENHSAAPMEPVGDAQASKASNQANGAAYVSSEPSIRVRLLIAEVQIAGASTTNDFVKIFNAGDSSADVGGWKLRKKTNSGKEYSVRVFPAGSAVPARGNFLWANSQNDFGMSVSANVSSMETIATDNSIALFDSGGSLVDAVAWGSSTNPFVEGSPYPANPGAGKNLFRKIFLGEMFDANDNSADFEIK